MGSGRGKNKRVSSSTPKTTKKGYTDEAPWHEFVAAAQLERETLGGYYGVAPADPDYVVKLARELFRDLVEIGSIVFPAGVVTADFSFQLVKGRRGTSGAMREDRLYLARVGVGSLGVGRASIQMECAPGYHFATEVLIGGGAMRNTIYSITTAAKALLAD